MRVGTSIELVACHESFANINQFVIHIHIYISTYILMSRTCLGNVLRRLRVENFISSEQIDELMHNF